MKRRGFVAALLAAGASRALAAPAAAVRSGDLDVLWDEIEHGYAYLDAERRRVWHAMREPLRREASRATSDTARWGVLRAAVERLRDDAVTLSHPAHPSPRIPFDLDIWPRWRGGVAVVEAVRTYSDADVAGIHPGHAITAIDGVPVARAIRERLRGAAANAADAEWALRRLLAERDATMRLAVREGGNTATVEVERARAGNGNAPPVLGRRMGDERDLGYLRLRARSDDRAAANFDGALGHMTGTRALIVDLREAAGPGSRATTLAILARFAKASVPWQWREARGGPRIADIIAPQGNAPYAAPVLVLVDRWTAGEAEALAAGLASVAGARLVGTPTAGLHGELHERVLPASGAVLRYPAERTFLANGAPRETLVPDVVVDPSAPSGGPGDPILYQALKLLERR